MDSGLAGILREPQEPAPRNDPAYDSNLKNDELGLVFVSCIGANDFFPTRQHRLDELSAARTILHRMKRHRDRIAGPHGIGTHAHGDEPPWRTQLNRPQ